MIGKSVIDRVMMELREVDVLRTAYPHPSSYPPFQLPLESVFPLVDIWRTGSWALLNLYGHSKAVDFGMDRV